MAAQPSVTAQPDDAALVQRVRDGDIDAFGVLVRRHQRAVHRVVMTMLHDDSAAENLVQQCFVQAFEALPRVRAGEDLEPWLKAIARNLVRQEVRRLLREDKRLREYREDLLRELESPPDDLERADRRAAEALAVCREGLAPAAAQALGLRYGEGHSLEAVASAIGRSVAATRQLLFRARIALRDCVERKLART